MRIIFIYIIIAIQVKIVIRYVRLQSCYLVRVYVRVYASEEFQENASIILAVIKKNCRLQTTLHIFIKIFVE